MDVTPILHEICESFGDSGGSRHRVVDQIEGTYFVTQKVNTAVGQIVTEATINALKYAYPVDMVGEVTVRSSRLDTGELLVEVIDHGVGAPPAPLSTGAASFGVRLMRGLARQANIGLSFVNASPGLAVRIVLPRQPIQPW